MNIAVLGTGDVGRLLGSGLVRIGHRVTIAGRTAESGRDWPDGPSSDFESAAGGAELVVLAVSGSAALSVAGRVSDHLDGKVVWDLTNPLEFPPDAPMRLSIANDWSLAEEIQASVPGARVVKALNTVNSHVMTHPEEIPGDHAAFYCGNDETARSVVAGMLAELGWRQILDLGDLTAARGMESYLHLWLRIWNTLGHARFNVSVVSAKMR